MDTPIIPLRARHDGWTVARQQAFVAALAAGDSVTVAAASVGMSKASAYKLRQRPEATALRAAWDNAAVQVGRQIEETALDRVINGVVDVRNKGGVREVRRRPCSEQLLITMMKRVERLRAAKAR